MRYLDDLNQPAQPASKVVAPDLMVGDVLVQIQGEPWCTIAGVLTGAPYPHVAIVSRVDVESNRIWIIENSWDGLREKEPAAHWFKDFLARRPLTDEATIRETLNWINDHLNEGYGYGRLAEIVIGSLLGSQTRPGMDDDVSQDGRRKVCSETLAMGFYRAGQRTGSGYDAVPDVADRDTLPKDLRFSDRLRTLPAFVVK